MIRRLAVALLLVVPLHGQVSETIEVSLTSIDVVVTDAKGNRVRGLKKDDFEVLQNGQPREISNFTEYAGVASEPASVGETKPERATPGGTPPPPRRLMILFDGNSLTPTYRRASTQAAISFIQTTVRPTDQVVIAVLSQSFTPRGAWTNSPAELRRIISAVASETNVNRVDMELKRADDEIEYLIELAATADPPPAFNDLVKVAHGYAERALQETRGRVSLLGNVVTQMGAYPEKKAIIFIGEGLDARPGFELFQKLDNLTTGMRYSRGLQKILASASKFDYPLTQAGRYSATSVLDNLAAKAFSKGVPIYAINPARNEDSASAPERRDATADPGQQFARFASNAQGYEMVGKGSGGDAYSGIRADLALAHVAADLDAYYSIGFRASAAPKDAGALRVRTKRGYRVRVSLATAAPLELADAVSEAVTAHHVLEPATNDLEIALEALEPMPAGEKQKVTLHVIIPIRNLTLVRQGDDVTGGFDVYLSISDGKGYFSTVNKQSHAIKWSAATAGEDDERTMTYSIDVVLEPGASQISVGVVDQRSKKTGYERISV